MRRLFLLLAAAGFLVGAVGGGLLGARLAAADRAAALPARFELPWAHAGLPTPREV